jgi:hypothetical protein
VPILRLSVSGPIKTAISYSPWEREEPRVPQRAARTLSASADGAWDEFYTSMQKDSIFRLNPTYSGHGFELDEFQKLNEIERQAEEWIATQNTRLTTICDRLVDALFFFCVENHLQVGEYSAGSLLVWKRVKIWFTDA